MKILVSGYTSPIGRNFVAFAKSRGHKVELLGSNLSGGWRLGERLPKGVSADGFVHFAHDRSRSLVDMSRDIEMILTDFRGHPILISTVSAHKRSKSRYGKSKLIAEDMFLNHGGAVLKCGLIVGDLENRFMSLLEDLTQRFPIVFLPFAGKSNFYFTRSSALLEEIEFTLLNGESGRIRAFQLLPYSMERIVKSFNSTKRSVVLPVPSVITRVGILTLGKLSPKSNLLDSMKSLITEISLEELIELKPPKNDFSISPLP
jgi:hypothetical protein